MSDFKPGAIVEDISYYSDGWLWEIVKQDGNDYTLAEINNSGVITITTNELIEKFILVCKTENREDKEVS